MDKTQSRHTDTAENTENNGPLLLIDGYGLIYRSYFAFINRPLKDPEGNNISAVYGFFRSLFSLMRDYKPRSVVVALDSVGPTFRHDAYAEYKATREKSPDDLKSQIPIVERILQAMQIPSVRAEGFEADDVIATITDRCVAADKPCLVVSNDKDLLQLVDGLVRTLRYEKGAYAVYDSGKVEDELGIRPDQIIDYLSLLGDSADNIPGVKGIGKKSAAKLLQEHDSLDGIYAALDAVSAGNRKKLEAGKESAYKSRELVVLKRVGTVNIDVCSITVDTIDWKSGIPEFAGIGAKSLIKDAGGNPDDYSMTSLDRSRLDGENAAGNTGSNAESDHSPESIVRSNNLSGEGSYTIITSLEQLDAAVLQIREAAYAACDIETDSLNAMQANISGLSFSVRPREAWYIPITAGGTSVLDEGKVKERMREILEDPEMHIIGQNFAYDYKVLVRWGVTPKHLSFDTMIAGWLLDAVGNSFSMDKLAEKYLDYKTIRYRDTVEKGQLFPDVELGKAGQYAAEDADVTYRLYVLFTDMLKQRNLENVFNTIEMPLQPLLARMELKGIKIRSDELKEYAKELKKDLEQIEESIFSMCGKEFNINSTKQLQEVLFKDRRLKPVKKTKTGYSTDTSVLEMLAMEDEVPLLILRHRSLSKLLNTYVTALPELIDRRTGRIHTSFTQTGTATGRLSSRNPNLQNIPIRTEEGRRIRRAFVPDEGCVFVSADYAQIELVVLAHLADDPGLQEAFRSGQDIHRHTGSLIFQVPPEEVTSEQRRIAKTINFGVMYGMSAFRLSRELGIPREQAEGFIDSYFSRYPSIRTFIERTVREAEKTGKVKTLLGHERIIPGINSRNKTEKAGAERIAVNTPIQGTAADIMKLAMLTVDRRLREENYDAEILLQIHDEVLIEAAKDQAAAVEKLVKQEMEHIIELKVPLRVSIETGENWGDLH